MKEKALLRFKLVKNFKLVNENNPGTHSPQQNQKSRVDDSILELVEVTNFSLNWQFWFFRTNLPKKGVSRLKEKKWTAPLSSGYSS